MRQKRSHLTFGSGGLTYMIATALIFIAAVYTQANLLFWAFGLMSGGLVVSILFGWLMLRSIEVHRQLPNNGVTGQMVAINYQITNRSRVPAFSLVIEENWGRGERGWKRSGPMIDAMPQIKAKPTGWVLHLGTHQPTQAQAVFWALRRGIIRFERITVSTSFPFGVIRKVINVRQTGQLLIYPRLYQLDPSLLARLPRAALVGQKRVPRGGGMDEFFGLRPYRAGDSLKLIDWKHSARIGELISREMAQTTPPRVMVLLDLSEQSRVDAVEQAKEIRPGAAPDNRGDRGGGNGETASIVARGISAPDESLDRLTSERAISLAASVIDAAHLRGFQIGLHVRGVRCRTFDLHHSAPHRDRMLMALCQLNVGEFDTSKEVLPAMPTVVIVPGLSERAEAARRVGFRPIVLGGLDLHRYVSEGAARSTMQIEPSRAANGGEATGGTGSEAVAAKSA